MSLERYLPEDILRLYEVLDYRNAAQILRYSATADFTELLEALSTFRFSLDDIRKPGGSESNIPKKISLLLRDKGWKETRIKGDLIITKIASAGKTNKFDDEEESESETLEEIEELAKKNGDLVEKITRANFLDGHKVDYVKNRVAFDLEWNSKDQTFDRDLYAFRAFYDCDLIDAAVLLTRSEKLNPVFDQLGVELDKDGKPKMKANGKPKLIKEKYGASTTWIGKLKYRMVAGRHGGCPVLVLGITPGLISDYKI